jgi:hypothetical protein
MSGENPDSDGNRSRSIFRQVRETLGGMSRSRHRVDTRMESSPLTLINNERKSADNIDLRNIQTKPDIRKSTPISFSHHLSLLNQVKSHINKTKKSHPSTSLSSWENDDYTHLSLPPMNSKSVS